MIDITWEQVHALEVSAVEAYKERIIKVLKKKAHTGIKTIVAMEFKGLLKAITIIEGKN